MQNCTFKKLNFFKLTFFIVFFLFSINSFSQICGTPGGDGPITVESSVNTYYPIFGESTLNTGGKSVFLDKVPATDRYKNNFGTIPISIGDLILIIQMQDASIDYTNSNLYGSGTSGSGRDGLGGTGFKAIGNTGIFEYVIATSNVPLTGGNLTFKGTGTNGGTYNSYVNAAPTTAKGKSTFQIVRVPQYSNLKLTKNITTPPFNGVAGGIIAFNVSGNFDFNKFTIDGSSRGFRGGYSPKNDSGGNNATTYVGEAKVKSISGKGEGIAGTPKFMWDGFNEVVNVDEGMPGGSSGRGAPANAGGGGNDHNSGGGGGGNGGFGGLGGYGWQGGGGAQWTNANPLTGGGRPGYLSFRTDETELTRLIMGGGGGAGDANDAKDGVKGGVGGAIVLINAGTVKGPGTIEVNGGAGAAGVYQNSSDGAGGAGAGGTVLLNISGATTNGIITINANGGDGGNTANDTKNEHGPGGGGGGGIIRHNIALASVKATAKGGPAGLTNGDGVKHGAEDGTPGIVAAFTNDKLPPYLQVNSSCFPILTTTVKALPTASACSSVNEKVSYEIQITNTGVGNAAGVALDFLFPLNIGFDSAIVKSLVDASLSSSALTNTSTNNRTLLGDFNIAQNGVVTITLVGKLTGTIAAGEYSSSAQALYLDPTRSSTPNRKITAFIDAFVENTTNKTYQGGQGNVPGSNFNGAGTKVDDIIIYALPETPKTEVTQLSCSMSTGTITVTSPANGANISYTIKGANPATVETTTTGVFSGLAPNTYVVTTTNANGCVSLATGNIVINAAEGAPKTTGASVCQGDRNGALLKVTSSTCNVRDINWYLTDTGGDPIASGAEFNPFTNNKSGLTATSPPGTKTYYAACGNSTCRTATNFVINAKPTITSTTQGSRCDAGTVILKATASAGTINWYDSDTGVTLSGTGPEFTTPSLTVNKNYYVEVTNNGCTSARTLVKATVNTTPTITSTRQGAVCGPGEVVLTATASTGAEIQWFADSTGDTLLATGPTFTIEDLSVTTTYYVGARLGDCTSSSRRSVAAVVSIPSEIKLTTGAEIANVCTGSDIQSTIYTFSGSATNATVTNLPAGLKSDVDEKEKTVTISGTPTADGTYTITTVGHTTPCSAAIITGDVKMNAKPAKPTANTPTQPTCALATGSFTLGGLPSGSWTIQPGNINGSGSTKLIEGLTSATYNFTVTNAAGCTSPAVEVVINDKPVAPAQPEITTTPATCSAAASSKINNYVSGNAYSFNPGGPSVDALGLISNMVIGTGYTVTSTKANCISLASASFSNAAKLETPAQPEITTTPATCSAVASSKIKNYVSGNAYSFNPGGPSVDALGLISNMVIGTGYTVTSTKANCISPASASFSNAAKLETPAQPEITTTTATCSAAASSKIKNYVLGNTYTFDPAGPSVDALGLISNMVIGTGYTVTSTKASCISPASASFSNVAKLETPAQPEITTTTATCSAAA
ncbi:immunoglobulin domain-containing protein, partial [Flavobacterium branchiarum]